MAIKKCKECGNDVSEQAKTCPHCGVSAPAGKKHVGCLGSSLVILAALIFFTNMGNSPESNNTAQPTPAQPITAQPITAKDIRVDELLKCFSGWDGSHIELTKLIKEGMKNPDSYDHVETKYSDKGNHLIVITQYRGTNSFGAVVTESVIAETLLDCSVKSVKQ